MSLIGSPNEDRPRHMSENTETFSDKELIEKIEAIVDKPDEPPVITSARLADALDMTRRATGRRLKKIVEETPYKLGRAKLGNTNVYWKTGDEPVDIIPEADEEIFEEYTDERGIDRHEGILEIVDMGLEEMQKVSEVRTDWENREAKLWGLVEYLGKMSAGAALLAVASSFMSLVVLDNRGEGISNLQLGLETVATLGLGIVITGVPLAAITYFIYIVVHYSIGSRLHVQPGVLRWFIGILKSAGRRVKVIYS